MIKMTCEKAMQDELQRNKIRAAFAQFLAENELVLVRSGDTIVLYQEDSARDGADGWVGLIVEPQDEEEMDALDDESTDDEDETEDEDSDLDDED